MSEESPSRQKAAICTSPLPKLRRRRDRDALLNRSSEALHDGDEALWARGLDQFASEYEHVAAGGGRIPPDLAGWELMLFVTSASMWGNLRCVDFAFQRIMQAIARGGNARDIKTARSICSTSLAYLPEILEKALGVLESSLVQNMLAAEFSSEGNDLESVPKRQGGQRRL